MPPHLSTASDNGELTGHDRMTCFLMGRLQVVEAALYTIARRSEDFEKIKIDLTTIVDAWREKAKAGGKSEEEAAMFEAGYAEALRSILFESKSSPAP